MLFRRSACGQLVLELRRATLGRVCPLAAFTDVFERQPLFAAGRQCDALEFYSEFCTMALHPFAYTLEPLVRGSQTVLHVPQPYVRNWVAGQATVVPMTECLEYMAEEMAELAGGEDEVELAGGLDEGEKPWALKRAPPLLCIAPMRFAPVGGPREEHGLGAAPGLCRLRPVLPHAPSVGTPFDRRRVRSVACRRE
jgi:hypothetical protein